MSACEWVGDLTSMDNPPYFSLYEKNTSPPTAGNDSCGKVVVVVGGHGGTIYNSIAITPPIFYSVSFVTMWVNERKWKVVG